MVDAVVMVIPAQLVKALVDHALPPEHHNRHLVAVIALVAVGLAFADAMLSLVQRYFSSRVGEGLIYDLRVALFDHVQRMPLAFFTRTQTGALQSRLNNDVVGAQQAVTSTLGTVVSNVISLAVVLTVMFRMEWRLTLLTLIVLPAFILPARRFGPRMQHLTRQGMQLNAEMNNLTVERFNVAGAMLAKLFGRQSDERTRFSERAAGVRDIGVRTAIYSRILFVALGLVAAVGTAVVYFVGGNLAISGTISSGTVIAFMIYVGQMYQPLAQLTNSRVDILTALVSFERVFEVLDFPAAIADSARRGRARRAEGSGGARPGVVPPPAGPRSCHSRHWRHPAHPAARSRASGSCATCRSASLRARRSRSSDPPARARRPSRCSCPACTTSRRARCASTAAT